MIKFCKLKDPFGCFSNFSRHPVYYNLWNCKTSEHAYQAMKFDGTEYADRIVQVATPREAANLGRDKSFPLRPDWEEIKDQIMYEVVFAKFKQNEEIQEVLLSTGDQEIVEDSTTYGDSYWGCGRDGKGRNQLGKTLMKVREELRNVKR